MERDEEEKYLARGADIQSQLAQLFSQSLNIPTFSIDPKFVEDVYDAVVRDVPNLKSLFSQTELRREVSDFVGRTVVFRPKDSELGDRINEFIEGLLEEKEYEAILLLKGLIGLPIGTKLGAMEIIQKDENRKELLEHIRYLEDKRLIYPDNCSWARIVFTSHRMVDVSDVLFRFLELPYSILSLIMHMNLDPGDTVGAIFSKRGSIWFLGGMEVGTGWSRYRSDVFGKHMNRLSSISQKRKPTRLEKKVMQAIQVFWLSRLSSRLEIRFVVLVSAFESLLLTQNDRDYLGLKLAEKTSFLLEDDKDRRVTPFKAMKKFYAKRSDLVHKGQNTIEEKDERETENIFKALVFKLLDLTAEYGKMEQKSHASDRPGVEDYIDALKFA